jgi:parvulin-like peptidyl-prolyl isomerase
MQIRLAVALLALLPLVVGTFGVAGEAAAQPRPPAKPGQPAQPAKPAPPAEPEEPAEPAEPADPEEKTPGEGEPKDKGNAEESAEQPTAQPRKSKAPVKPGARLVVDRVVAVVNDSVILHSELMRRVAPLVAEYDEAPDPREKQRRMAKLKLQMLDEMVNEELIIQSAEQAKLEVSAKEVQSAIEEIKGQNKLDDNQLAEALRLQGYTMASYRRDVVRRQILRMRATNMLVRPRVTVTDDDVRTRYDAMTRRSAGVKRIKLRHILLKVPDKPTEAQLAEAKRKAAEIIEKVRSGGDFARLAADLSDDEATKYSGGEIGWIERGSIDTEWEVIVFAMNKGEVRGPITGPSGLHVFQVTDVERNQQKQFAEMKEQLRNELWRKEMERQTKLWLDELRDKAHIERKTMD